MQDILPPDTYRSCLIDPYFAKALEISCYTDDSVHTIFLCRRPIFSIEIETMLSSGSLLARSRLCFNIFPSLCPSLLVSLLQVVRLAYRFCSSRSVLVLCFFDQVIAYAGKGLNKSAYCKPGHR